MAFNGVLIKLGGSSGTAIPMKYISAESYQITPNQRMELTAERDSNGVLHRSVVSNKPVKIEFETPYLNNTQVQALNALLENNYSVASERKISVYYYDTSSDSYKTENCYVPDIQYTINHIDVAGQKIVYNPIRIAFIGY